MVERSHKNILKRIVTKKQFSITEAVYQYKVIPKCDASISLKMYLLSPKMDVDATSTCVCKDIQSMGWEILSK